MKNSIVSINGLEKTFVSASESLTVLSDLNLEIEERKKIVIAGESGSGKSTLLNIIGGIDSATKGSVQAGQWKVTSLKEKELSKYRSSFVGLIFQFHYLLKDFTALENVYMPALIAGKPEKEAIAKAEALLQDVGVYNRKDHLPSQLSGGERQRVAVARALINDPALILADEPTGNLDSKNSAEIMELLRNSNRDFNQTMIIITHDENIALQCDRIITVSDGHIVNDVLTGIN